MEAGMIPLNPAIYDWLAQMRWPWLVLYFRASQVQYGAHNAHKKTGKDGV